MAKLKKRMKGGAIVLASGSEMQRGGAQGPMLKAAPAELFYQAGGIMTFRKLFTAEYEKELKKVQDAKPAGRNGKRPDLTEAEKKAVLRGLGWKALGLGYVGIRTFEKGDLTGAGSFGLFANGCVAMADSF